MIHFLFFIDLTQIVLQLNISKNYGYQESLVNSFSLSIQCYIRHERKEEKVAFLEANHPACDFTTDYAHHSKGQRWGKILKE